MGPLSTGFPDTIVCSIPGLYLAEDIEEPDRPSCNEIPSQKWGQFQEPKQSSRCRCILDLNFPKRQSPWPSSLPSPNDWDYKIKHPSRRVTEGYATRNKRHDATDPPPISDDWPLKYSPPFRGLRLGVPSNLLFWRCKPRKVVWKMADIQIHTHTHLFSRGGHNWQMEHKNTCRHAKTHKQKQTWWWAFFGGGTVQECEKKQQCLTSWGNIDFSKNC